MVAFAFGASAQSIGDYIDVLYLKNGSVVKGVIVEQIPGQSVKIKTQDGSEFVYEIQDVSKFTREESPTSMNSNRNGMGCFGGNKWFNADYKAKEKGFYTEVGMGANSSAYAFRITQGYKFGRLGYLGLAIGLENVALNTGERLPEMSLNIVYAGDVFNRKVTPFYQIEAGYGFSMDRYGYNRNILNGNNFFGNGFGFGKGNNDDVFIDSESVSTLNYGGPQGALVLGFKVHTMKRLYFKLGLDARITSNFSDVHFLTFDDFGAVSGSITEKNFEINPGVGARFTLGF